MEHQEKSLHFHNVVLFKIILAVVASEGRDPRARPWAPRPGPGRTRTADEQCPRKTSKKESLTAAMQRMVEWLGHGTYVRR